MPCKLRQLKAQLRKAGFTERPGKGSHTRWSHPLVPDPITLAGHDGDDAKSYQERAVQEALQTLHDAQRRQH